MMDGMMGGGGMAVLMVFWIIFALVLLALAVAALIWLIRNLTGRSSRSSGGPESSSAERELDRRYARGELSREDYLQARSDLERG